MESDNVKCLILRIKGQQRWKIIVGIMQGFEGVSTRISHDERITNERSRKAEFIIWVKSKKF